MRMPLCFVRRLLSLLSMILLGAFCCEEFTTNLSNIEAAEFRDSKVVAVKVATNSENSGYEAVKAFDGDRETFWHSMFSQAPFEYSPIQISCGYSCGCVDQHPKRKFSRKYDSNKPFELRVDLGTVFDVEGIRYWPRNDLNNNGQVGEYEVYAFENLDDFAGDNANDFLENGDWNLNEKALPVADGCFNGGKDELENGALVSFGGVKKVRYLIFRAKTELKNQQYSSVAELEILADGYDFLAAKGNMVDSSLRSIKARYVSEEEAVSWGKELFGLSSKGNAGVLEDSPYFDDLRQQHNRLVYELKRPDYYEAISNQLPTAQSGVCVSDQDPVDVVLRRTKALYINLKELDEDFFEQDKSKVEENLVADWLFCKECADYLKQTPIENVKERFQVYLLLSFWRRSLLFQRCEIDFDKLLFVKRNRSNYNHLCDQFYGRSAVAGGGLFILDHVFGTNDESLVSTLSSALNSLGKAPNETNLTSVFNALYLPKDNDLLADSVVTNDCRLKGKKLDGGAFIAPELSFDGKEIAFAYCECEGSADHVETLDLTRGHTQEGRCYHLFKCDVDGNNLKMISDGTWNDFDPCFLPNGRLAFISERRNGYLRCGRDCPTYTLFDMNPDGSKIRCLSRHETNEWAPSVSNNGQILWTRWDYIDRFGCIAHGAWTTSPDGRNPRAICGNYAPRHLRPDSVLDIRAIPGSSKLIATAGPHHGQSFGSIVEIDPNAPDDPISPVTRMTPEIGFPESQDGAQVWGTPWPLAEDLFLAVADYSFAPNSGREGGKYEHGAYGIYLVDAFGNRELIYRDKEIGSSTPIPLVARETPPVVPSLESEEDIVDEPFVQPLPFDAERPQGVVSIQNVYNGDYPFPEGTKVTSIRVIQVFCMSVPSGYPPYETGVREATSTDSVKLTRRVWGVAPVEEDGSACFYVPANCELYFQALDENGVVVQSMRSGTALRPNENLSCVGCHEPRNLAGVDQLNNQELALDGKQVPLALRREPSKLASEGIGTQPINYPELVQPIWDEHCVSCHNSSTHENGDINLEKGPYSHGFYASYWNLIRGGFAFNDFGDSLRTIPEQYGTRASSLYSLIQDHHGVKLTDAERRRVALWLDTNTMFFGVYEKEGCEKELRGERAVPTLE